MANTKNDFPSDMDDIEMIDITYEDGTSCSCEVIAHFDVEDISYAALLPEGDEDSDILVYRYSENGDDVELCEICLLYTSDAADE